MARYKAMRHFGGAWHSGACKASFQSRICRMGGWNKDIYIYPIGSMYAIYGNIYHQYTPNVSIYTIHGSYGYIYI